MPVEQELAQLTAEARYAEDRVTVYRQRMYSGRGEPRRLAELERIAAGAGDRLARHRAKSRDETGQRPAALAQALEDVADRLDAPGVSSSDRVKLLLRQAELGDLRDELALRARRRAGEDARGRGPR